jgi:hypothetical protein
VPEIALAHAVGDKSKPPTREAIYSTGIAVLWMRGLLTGQAKRARKGDDRFDKCLRQLRPAR